MFRNSSTELRHLSDFWVGCVWYGVSRFFQNEKLLAKLYVQDGGWWQDWNSGRRAQSARSEACAGSRYLKFDFLPFSGANKTNLKICALT